MNHQESLASYHFHKVTMPDGRMFGAPTLVRLVDLLDKSCGVKVNRTAILRAMHPRKQKKAGSYRDMVFERVVLSDMARFPRLKFCPIHQSPFHATVPRKI